MKKILFTIAFLLAWTSAALATDVTITQVDLATNSVSAKIPNFNVSNLGGAITISSVTVTNGTYATLTCSACFRPTWVGLGGFTIKVGTDLYTVRNVDSTSQVTLTKGCTQPSPSAVIWYPYVEFRIYADRAFQPLGANYVVQPGTPGTGSWYKRYAASILDVNSVKTLYLPEMTIDATTDSPGPTNQARYMAGFYRPDNSFVQFYACFEQFVVPPTTPTTWTALCAYNSPPAIVPPANEAYTKTQIDARFPSCTTGQMIYYATTGNAQSCLTVGSGLSISGGTIISTGSGVTSVALSLPNIFTVSGSPVTTTGTLTGTLATQDLNTVFAGPATGTAAATPTFRTLQEPDMMTTRGAINAYVNGYCSGAGATTTTGGITSGTNTLTVASANTWRVGEGIWIDNAGVAGADLQATVAAISGTTFTLDVIAGSTVVGATVQHDDTACLASSLLAAATAGRASGSQLAGKILYLPAGQYNIFGTLTVPGGVTLEGDGRDKTIIYSQYNGVILDLVQGSGASLFYGPTVRNLAVKGVVTAGTSQIGIRATDASYMFNVHLSQVDILNTGSHGLSVGSVYSSTWTDMFISNTAGYPLLYDAVNMPTNRFTNIYVGNLTATAPTAFRIKRGDFNCHNCNGINNTPAGAKWAVVGRKNGVDGDVIDCDANNCGADFSCTDCNLESYDTHGVLAYGASVISMRGKYSFQPAATGSKAIEYDLVGQGAFFYPEFVRRGILEDSGGFSLVRADWANSNPIHANGFAPIETAGFGPAVVSENTLDTYYNSTAGVSQKLSRKDAYAPVETLTGSKTVSLGTRYVEVSCVLGCTVTLPWPGYARNGDTITLRNVTGNGYLGTVNIVAASGGTVAGLSSLALPPRSSRTYTLKADPTALDWKIVGTSGSLAEAVNVRDYGCVGDGSADDTTCLDRAFKLAKSLQVRSVYIPGGTYLTDPIITDLGGLVIWGDGPTKSIIKARQNDQNVFSITVAGGAAGLTLRDFGVHGRGKAAGTTGHCIYINDPVSYLSEFKFSNLEIKNCRQNGLDVPYIFNGVIERVSTDEIGGNHFDLGPANTVTLTGNYVHTVESGAVGYRLRGGAYTLIGNNGMDPDSPSTAIWGLFGSKNGDGGDTVDSYFNGAFIGNNVEDFGTTGIRLKENSKFGSISGNSFLSSSDAGTHIAIKYDYAGGQTPASIWDQSNTVTLVGGSWANGAAIHSQGAPLFVVGSSPAQYYETSFPALVDLPQVASSWDSGLNEMFAKSPNIQADNLKVGTASTTTGQLVFQNGTNGNRLILQAGATGSNLTFTLPTADGAASDCLTTNGAGVLSFGACGGSSLPVADTQTIVKGSSDATKLIRFEVDGLTTATTRVLTPPDADIVIAGSAAALTSGRVPYVTTGGLLTDSARLLWDNSTYKLSLSNASTLGLLLQAGGGTTAAHPGGAYGLILPYVGGGQTSGPGIWWTDGTYTSMVGLWLNLGLNFQGTGGVNNFKIRKSTDAGSDGAIVFDLRPNDGRFDLYPYGVGAGNTTQIAFRELAANGTNYVAFKGADSLAGDVTWTLPSTDSSGTQCLASNGSGTLSWNACSGAGTPGGSNKQVQFNNSSAFGGATGFEYQSGASPNVSITAQNAAYVPLYVNGASSQTANIQQWAVNGTVYNAITKDGYLYLGRGETSATPSAGRIYATGGSGTNIAGASLILYGGAGTGTGAGGSLAFYTAAAGGSGSSLNTHVIQYELDQLGNHFFGNAQLAQAATDGFVHIPGIANVPSGVPTLITGLVPLAVDETNYRLYGYSGGSWRNLTGGASGLTVGTTAIASGTAGRVLYEASGNVLGEAAGITYQTGASPTTTITAQAASYVGLRVDSAPSPSADIVQFTNNGTTKFAFYSDADEAKLTQSGASGSTTLVAQLEQNVTLSTGGATTDTSIQIPANSLVLSVSYRVTTTIADVDSTDIQLGDATQATRFRSGASALTSGTTGVGLNHLQGSISTDATGPVVTSATAVRITLSGGADNTPSAGAVRVTIHYIQLTAATS